MKKGILIALVALLSAFEVMAVPARPGKIIYTQPDGTILVLQLKGDEFGHWAMDASGQAYVADETGRYVPATDAEISELRINSSRRRSSGNIRRAAVKRAAADPVASGQKHFLVVLVEFTDLSFVIEEAQQAFTDLLNQPGYSENGGTGSARDFYYDNSNGYFEPVFDVYGPVQVGHDYAYYGKNQGGDDARPEEALIEGCKGLDEVIDFSQYDNDGDGKVDMVFMYYAGYNEAEGGSANTIWPHQWDLSYAGEEFDLDGVTIDKYACTSELRGSSGSTMSGIGAACHEFGHAMGLPDMYDTDYTTNGEAGALYSYSTMCSGSYNNDGCTPPYFNFEERILLGWVSEDDYLTFDKSGVYTIPPVTGNVAYRTFTDQDGEYFVYESRPQTGWDAYNPGEGLLVYHADKSSRRVRTAYGTYSAYTLWNDWESTNCINENGSHPCFYLIPSASQSNLNYYYESRIPFPFRDQVTSYVPLSWNGVEGTVSFSEISLQGSDVKLRASVATGDIGYLTIADAGSYRAGDRFTFLLVHSDEVEVETPSEVLWYYDDEPVRADSVSLTAGEHTVEAVLSYADGRRSVLTLEITVE